MGYPAPLYRTIGHPVTWIGALIGALDATLNRPDLSETARRAGGIVAAVVIVAVPAVIASGVQTLAMRLPFGIIAVAVLASTLIASRSLYDHAGDVALALRSGGLTPGRVAVSRIVGRDVSVLDEAGVARAAIESLAENASDGIVAPVLWFALLGLPGIAAYKAINTADSMIGHRTQKYDAFGWAAARLDDFINLPASRLTGLLFTLAACVQPGASPLAALKAMMRDAQRHRSPNAGWPESAMAGALDLKLAGPRYYGGALVEDAFMGDGRREATSADIDRALRLSVRAWLILAALIAFAAVIARS